MLPSGVDAQGREAWQANMHLPMEVEAVLQKRWKPTLSVEDGLKLGVQAMKEYLKDQFNVERVDAAFIKMGDKKFTKIANGDIKGYLK